MPEVRIEYRTLGDRTGYGPWVGGWTNKPPKIWDLREMRRRGEVYVELREVMEGDPVRITDEDVEAFHARA